MAPTMSEAGGPVNINTHGGGMVAAALTRH